MNIVNEVEVFYVENLRTARRFLRAAGFQKNFDELIMLELNKDTPHTSYEKLFNPLTEKKVGAILSEAGCPGIADPGADFIYYLHQNEVAVTALSGPSSIFMALMASGLNGQNFSFNGYLPIDQAAQKKKIKELESISTRTGNSQIFMETPYRNNRILDFILAVCQDKTRLHISADISSQNAFVKTANVKYWKKHKPDLHKRPTIFILQA